MLACIEILDKILVEEQEHTAEILNKLEEDIKGKVWYKSYAQAISRCFLSIETKDSEAVI